MPHLPVRSAPTELCNGLVSVIVDINVAKEAALWGTYGKFGKDTLHYKRLKDCSTEHLYAILDTQPQISLTDYELIITIILEEREREKGKPTSIWKRIRKFLASRGRTIF